MYRLISQSLDRDCFDWHGLASILLSDREQPPRDIASPRRWRPGLALARSRNCGQGTAPTVKRVGAQRLFQLRRHSEDVSCQRLTEHGKHGEKA
jgi:hypothetical protein